MIALGVGLGDNRRGSQSSGHLHGDDRIDHASHGGHGGLIPPDEVAKVFALHITTRLQGARRKEARGQKRGESWNFDAGGRGGMLVLITGRCEGGIFFVERKGCGVEVDARIGRH